MSAMMFLRTPLCEESMNLALDIQACAYLLEPQGASHKPKAQAKRQKSRPDDEPNTLHNVVSDALCAPAIGVPDTRPNATPDSLCHRIPD